MTILQQRLGRGPAFPLVPNPVRKSLDYHQGSRKVRESIELILMTEPGERVMRPDFGCGLRRFLMEPNTVATRSRLERTVTRALELFEPRINLLDVRAIPGDEPSLVNLSIRFEHRLDGSEGVLVYPFYLEASA
ncbi:MAG: GPW/gp25 family protein [Acidimicrobiia bacterium]|nr:GPW/gp25 family protein [Acidimicrobiia bacterium]